MPINQNIAVISNFTYNCFVPLHIGYLVHPKNPELWDFQFD